MELIEFIFIFILINFGFKNIFSFISILLFINSSININRHLLTQETTNPFFIIIKKSFNFLNEIQLKLYYTNIFLSKKSIYWEKLNKYYVKTNTYFKEYINLNKILLVQQFSNYINHFVDEMFIKTKKNNTKIIDLSSIISNFNTTISECLDEIKNNTSFLLYNKNNNEIDTLDKMISDLENIEKKYINLYDSDEDN